MTGAGWLALALGLALGVGVGVPLLGDFLRKRDFKRQITGKRPERRADDNVRAEEPPQAPTEADAMKYIAELKSKQNVWGGK